MPRVKKHSPYYNMLHQRRKGAWFIAVLGAVGLNLMLFALVPYLLSTDQEIEPYENIVSGINVVRMQEPEQEEPEEVEPPEEEEREQEPEPRKEPASQAPEQPELSLPFEINPRLPSGPQSLAMPEMRNLQLSSVQDKFSAGELDQPLSAVSRTPPQYPMSAKRRNIEGWVKVRFVVDKEGQVQEVSIVDEEPEGVFDQAVQDCISRWRFEPGTVGGVPVQTVAETTIRFELD